MGRNDIDDLKQFIAAVISQQTADLREELAGTHADIRQLDRKVDDLSASVAEALDTTDEVTEKRLQDHKARTTKLEHQSA